MNLYLCYFTSQKFKKCLFFTQHRDEETARKHTPDEKAKGVGKKENLRREDSRKEYNRYCFDKKYHQARIST